VAVGAQADLVLFDPVAVADQATYDNPRLPPLGIQRVWVGARPVVVGGQLASSIDPAES
jgi:N-acyl-D-aspartate/D-glutamate deacylase